MKTQDEIIARIHAIKASDFFGTQTGDLVEFLDFAKAKEFLTDTAIEAEWKPSPLTREYVLESMRDYMPFAWEKANGFRGLSASRSIDHFTSWIWLLGDLEEFGDLSDYEFYGKDKLVSICDKYSLPNHDDGVRLNEQPEYD